MDYRDLILRFIELLIFLRNSAVHYSSLIAPPFYLRRFHRSICTRLSNILGIFFLTELVIFRGFFISIAFLKN